MSIRHAVCWRRRNIDGILASLLLENRHIWRQIRHVGGDVRVPADVSGVKIKSCGLELYGRFFSPTIGHADPKRAPAVLLLHGIPGTEQNYDIAYALRHAGIHCLMFHYRGCWGSPGKYAITNLEQDIDAALSWLCEQPNVDTEKLVVVGHSLGGYHALRMAIAGRVYSKNKSAEHTVLRGQKGDTEEGVDDNAQVAQRPITCMPELYSKIKAYAALCPLIGTDDIGVPLGQTLSTEFASFLTGTSGPELEQQWAGLKSIKDMLKPLSLLQKTDEVLSEAARGEASQGNESTSKPANVSMDAEALDTTPGGDRRKKGPEKKTGKVFAFMSFIKHVLGIRSKKERRKSREQMKKEEEAAKDAENEKRRQALPLMVITGDEDPLFSNDYYRKNLIGPLDDTVSFRYDWITKRYGDHALCRYRQEVVQHIVSFVCKSIEHNRWYMGERTAVAGRWIEAAPWDIMIIFVLGMFAGQLSVRDHYMSLERQLVGLPPVGYKEEEDEG